MFCFIPQGSGKCLFLSSAVLTVRCFIGVVQRAFISVLVNKTHINLDLCKCSNGESYVRRQL